MSSQQITGLKPRNALVASATKPMIYWSFAASAVETLNTTGTPLPALTAFGSPTFSGGGLVLDNSSGYTYGTANNAGLQAVFNLQQGVWLFWANVSMNAGASGQDHMLSTDTGAVPQARFNILKGTTHRPDVFLAFDGEGSATQYAGGTNEFAAATPTNICLIVDNRVGVKALLRYVNGVSVTGAALNANTGLTYNPATVTRVRIGSDCAFTPGNLFFGTLRRMGIANLTEMPANIAQIVQELHAGNSAPPSSLLLALQ